VGLSPKLWIKKYFCNGTFTVAGRCCRRGTARRLDGSGFPVKNATTRNSSPSRRSVKFGARRTSTQTTEMLTLSLCRIGVNVRHVIICSLCKTRISTNTEGPRDAQQIRNIALENACNREMTSKDTQGHHNYRYQIGCIQYKYYFLVVACCYIISI